MTGRERLTAILKKQPTDRMSWSPLVDNNSLNLFPKNLRGNGGIDFYRHLGCDILLLNGWISPHSFRSPELRWPNSVKVCTVENNGKTKREWKTPQGTLTGVSDRGHPVKYPIDSRQAVSIYQQMWEGAEYVEHNDTAILNTLDTLVGNDGVVTRFWGPSAIPLLLEKDMGPENFYYLLMDYPDEMNALISTIHARHLQAFEILADGPCDSITLIENTSTYYISPDIYKRYNMPHQRDFVEIIKQQGKTAILHMCGHVLDLLDLIKETGCDGIHALTPSPTGNTPWEKALDVIGDDLIIFGALDPSIFISGPVDGIGKALDQLITPRLRDANFVLCPFTDGIPVEIERFYAVQQWMGENG